MRCEELKHLRAYGRRLPMVFAMARRWWHTLHSWIVVAVAPGSLGLLTFAAFWYAAARLRSGLMGLAALGYTAATVLQFIWAGPVGGQVVEPGFSITLAITMLVGTLHLIAVRPRLARALAGAPPTPPPTPPPTAPELPSVIAQDPAYRQAVLRRTRRAEARALVASDPALATELAVGRPDLDGEFDDGGLVDVNAVPAELLAGLPGFSGDLADEVVRARDRVGQLFSPEDLVVLAGVPAPVVDQLRDRLLFRV